MTSNGRALGCIPTKKDTMTTFLWIDISECCGDQLPGEALSPEAFLSTALSQDGGVI